MLHTASSGVRGSPMNNGQIKEREDWVEKALLGVIVGAVLFCAGLLAIPLWSAITQTASQQIEPHQCVAINNDAARLECYDRQISRRPTPPARGANPPETLFGQ
jgi:hypothetical protein